VRSWLTGLSTLRPGRRYRPEFVASDEQVRMASVLSPSKRQNKMSKGVCLHFKFNMTINQIDPISVYFFAAILSQYILLFRPD
jgi:hypothetical protein